MADRDSCYTFQARGPALASLALHPGVPALGPHGRSPPCGSLSLRM